MSITSKYLLENETYEDGLTRALRCWAAQEQKLEAQVAALTEAAKAVVDASHERAAMPSWYSNAISALAALIQESDDES